MLFLGHVVTQDGIKPNPKIVGTDWSWKELANVKEIKSFVGFNLYYRQYISNFSQIASLLTQLTENKKKTKKKKKTIQLESVVSKCV